MKQTINFYQDEFRKPKVVFPASYMVLILAASMLLILAGGGYQYWSVWSIGKKVEQLKVANHTQSSRIEERKAALELVKTDPQLEAKLQQLNNKNLDKRRLSSYINRMGLDTGRSISQFYKALTRNDMKGVWLNNIVLYGHGKDVSLTGMSHKASDVPVYIGQLKSDPVFNGLSFRSLTVKKSDKFPRYTEFQVDSRGFEDEG